MRSACALDQVARNGLRGNGCCVNQNDLHGNGCRVDQNDLHGNRYRVVRSASPNIKRFFGELK